MWLSFSKQLSLCKCFMIECCNQLRGFPGIPVWSQFLDFNISPLSHFFLFTKTNKVLLWKETYRLGEWGKYKQDRRLFTIPLALEGTLYDSMEPPQSFTAWGFVKTVETASFSTWPSGLNREELIAWKWADFAFILPRTPESCSPEIFEKLPFSPHLSQPFTFLIFHGFQLLCVCISPWWFLDMLYFYF